ncbi:MAG: DUF3494 domain-containing protein [Armatimonadetes bacterium]|nr:DUF3494 domain-containing protein [Armatimonadota bacterium]
MKCRLEAAVAAFTFLGLLTEANAQLLGTAESFAVLAGSRVTNTGPTVLFGDLGVWPGTEIKGFPPGIVENGEIHAGDAVAQQAQADVTIAYDVLEGEAFDEKLTGQDLGGMTLFAGVYHFSSSAFLTGTLTLDAQGDPNARFDFQIGSTLITASGSSVQVINSGDACNVYWQVGSSATVGTGTTFAGHILALTSITMETGSTILEGSALARNGAVTLDDNTIAACGVVPEPASIVALGAGLAVIAVRRRRK